MKYKFIDIGCGHHSVSSDIFGTDVRGMYVEPIKEYLEILPYGKNIVKENCAIFESEGEITLNAIVIENPKYFTNQEISQIVIDKKKKKEFARKYNGSGQSSIFDFKKISHKIKDRFKKITVKCLTVEQLFKKHNVSEVDFLKIDVEGAEEMILKQLIKLLEDDFLKINQEIKFEYNHLSNLQNLDNLRDYICEKFKYKWKFQKSLPWNEDIILTKII